jgi:branched-chain amino acid transport system ATP-binding protein
MLAIGRALITAPKILLLDEPSAGLAAGIIKALVKAITHIRHEGVGILLVEQRLEVAESIAERCIVLSAGTVVWQGTMHDAVSSDAVHRAYLA